MKLKNKVIALDSDEILSGFIDAFILFHNKTFKTSTKKEEIYSFELGQIWKISEEEVERRIEQFFFVGNAAYVKPIKGSKSGVNKLLKYGYKIHIITARPKVLEEKTTGWINSNFPNKFKGIHFAFNPYVKISKQKTKSEICKSIGAELLIEDNLVNAIDCAKGGIKVFLMDAPWNQIMELPGSIERVYNWKDITDKLVGKN